MAQPEQAESSVQHGAAGDAQGPVTHPGRAAGRLCNGPGSARRKELREMLVQSSSLSCAMLAAAVQMTASGPGLLVGPQEQKVPVESSLSLRCEWRLALAGGDTEHILRLLEQDPSLLRVADAITGFTALHWLAKHGQQKTFTEVISRARKKGCAISVDTRTTKGGLTPLILAAQQGHLSLVELLVKEYKADTSLRDHSGHKAWQYLRADTSRELMELAGAYGNNSAQPGTHGTSCEGGALHRQRQQTVPKVIRRVSAFFRRHRSASFT
ncbi:ankyrin repeat domain-containing protein SOWAHD [Cyrtonyx montezumae]|uniref:ankyrin repeat domain-containing protein SOWAHD n=1 Tax=Cyrtonyx montezumae TaxID=9017 RepID=UPI0032DAB168